MRCAASALIGAIGLAISAGAASATPMAPQLGAQAEANIVQVAGGCGWGFHLNRWGHCVPNRYSHYRPYRYWGYYGGGSPSDNVANELNRRELSRHGGYGWGY